MIIGQFVLSPRRLVGIVCCPGDYQRNCIVFHFTCVLISRTCVTAVLEMFPIVVLSLGASEERET